jgi:site-specific DNA-methyltransferase (adenine-specific)
VLWPTDYLNNVIQGDCLEVMKGIPDKSVDLVLTDPPYGLTQNEWDTKYIKKHTDLPMLMRELFRCCRGNVIVTSQQPFTTILINSSPAHFKYDIIWNKIIPTGFLNANKMPLRSHEIICVFGIGNGTYNPQKTFGEKNHERGNGDGAKNNCYGKFERFDDADDFGNNKHPKSIIEFKKPHPSITEHPTQKPVALFDWIIKTYSNDGTIILDPFFGSGTTGVAAKLLGRQFIGIEISEKYCDIARKRIDATLVNRKLQFQEARP